MAGGVLDVQGFARRPRRQRDGNNAPPTGGRASPAAQTGAISAKGGGPQFRQAQLAQVHDLCGRSSRLDLLGG